MKVVAFNGSPHSEGNTYHALKLALDVLAKEGIETEIIQIGSKEIRGCIGCGHCSGGECALADDDFRVWTEKLYSSDGVLLGSPVYYSGINGGFKCFLDRAFYQSRGRMRHKLGAAVAVPRRSGGLPAFDQMNHYFFITEMIIVGSNYWNVAHGARPGEVLQDTEGVSVMQTLGRNMAWMLKMKEYSKDVILPPESVKRNTMNFIR